MRSCCYCTYDGQVEISHLVSRDQLTHMRWVVFTALIQTTRRASSVVQNTGRLGGGSPPPNRPGRIGNPTWSGFGLPETLVRIQYLPSTYLFCCHVTCQAYQLTYMKWVVFTAIIQTSRRVSSVVRTLLFQEKVAAGSKVVERGRHLIGSGKLPGFGQTETLVQIQHLPDSFLFCSSTV